jgi:hypothetical protein
MPWNKAKTYLFGVAEKEETENKLSNKIHVNFIKYSFKNLKRLA